MNTDLEHGTEMELGKGTGWELGTQLDPWHGHCFRVDKKPELGKIISSELKLCMPTGSEHNALLLGLCETLVPAHLSKSQLVAPAQHS